MIKGYKIITLCGSTRFREQFFQVQKKLTLEGNIVISVGLFGHAGDDDVWKPGVKQMLDDMHLRKIDIADEIYVINVGGYIGESTKREILYAKLNGKKVNYFVNMKEIYLAGGCFWGTEHYFKKIKGVMQTQVGYANGITEKPTYKDVCTDKTRFAETVKVVYDPNVVGLRFLINMFFKAIDPLSLNQQGHDVGTQYRTGIYYTDPADMPIIEEVWKHQQEAYSQPIAVEKLPLTNFYEAEDYHQDYLDKNPDGYCHLPLELFTFAKNAIPTTD